MSAETTNLKLEAALKYAAHGLAVFPLHAGTKLPATPHGFKDATTDAERVRAWWAENLNYNIGLATGAVSGIDVLDIDVKRGKDGYAVLHQLGYETNTPTQVTPSGGIHLLYRHVLGTRSGVDVYGPGIDVRADGGYIVVAPSQIDGGRTPYAWLTPPFNSVPFATLPPRPASAGANGVGAPKRTTAEWLALLDGVGEGSRQATLPIVVGKLYAELEPELARELAHAWAERCNPPLTAEEVDSCCDRIEAREAAKLAPAEDEGGERYTDMANAERLALEGAGRVAHVDEMKDRFYLYDDMRLRLESKTAVVPFVKAVARRLYEEADALVGTSKSRRETLAASSGNMSQKAADAEREDIEDNEKLAEKRRAGAMRLESRDGAYAAIELAKAEPTIRVKLEQLDARPLWLNTPSGTLDLETGELHAHRFEDFLTRVTGAAYDPRATCPRWDAFLAEVLPDAEIRAFLQRSVGYALTDLTNEHCLWFLHGLGRNGKTTFINAIRAMLGDYAAATRASTLMVKTHGDDKRNDVAVLRGARFVSATEAEDGQQLAEALIKEVTGGDPVTARLLYAEFFTFTPTFKIWLAANHKPVIRGTDLGIWRRIHLVPFEKTIDEDRVDRDLPAALAAEASGILNWAINGLRTWQESGLCPPDAVKAATAAYRAESDPLREFFEEHIIEDAYRDVLTRDLYRTYQAWADASGVRRPLTQQMLGRELHGRGFRQHRTSGARMWRGLALRV